MKKFRTSKITGERLEEVKSESFELKSELSTIIINENEKFQTIEGFGGAFTEAGGYVLSKISIENRKKIIEAYFDKEKGIGYNFCRTHINSCDFSLGNYAYDEIVGDIDLEYFDISRDKLYLIPFIKEGMGKAGEDLRIFASPWSPPAWMKTNNSMNRGGSLKKELYETWAKYIAKYIKEYDKLGINIWGITPQNEPMAETPWDNCIYTDEEERDFIKVLGPVLKQQGLENVKIICFDHNKDIMKKRVDTIYNDKEAVKWVWGVGFHWYGADDTKSIVDNSVLDYCYEKYNANLVFTEGCNPLFNNKNFIGEWWTGEKYGRHIIADLNHWTKAWVDWNMVLDENGGPNHVKNYCDAPIIADTKNDKVYFNSPYYYIGHFSKFIKRGAVRIGFKNSNDKLYVTAVKNPDNSIVTIIMNETDEEIGYTLEINGEKQTFMIPKHSIETIIK